MRTLAREIFVYLVHIAISTIGIPLVAAISLNLTLQTIEPLGARIGRGIRYRLFVGSPLSPVYVVGGLLMGYSLERWLRDRRMLWVWVIPTTWLCIAILFYPTFSLRWPVPNVPTEISSASRLQVFFGSVCEVDYGCFDRLVTTFPFYSAACYSLGALCSRLQRTRLNEEE
jgi:hypothetical protein